MVHYIFIIYALKDVVAHHLPSNNKGTSFIQLKPVSYLYSILLTMLLTSIMVMLFLIGYNHFPFCCERIVSRCQGNIWLKLYLTVIKKDRGVAHPWNVSGT